MDYKEPTFLSCLEAPFSRSALKTSCQESVQEVGFHSLMLYLDGVFALRNC